MNQYDQSYINAVIRKLVKQGKTEEEAEAYINDMQGFVEADVREIPLTTESLKPLCKDCGNNVAENMLEHCQECFDKKPFCEFCTSKGVKHKKVCPTLKEKE